MVSHFFRQSDIGDAVHISFPSIVTLGAVHTSFKIPRPTLFLVSIKLTGFGFVPPEKVGIKLKIIINYSHLF